jgi:hypothetical protein
MEIRKVPRLDVHLEHDGRDAVSASFDVVGPTDRRSDNHDHNAFRDFYFNPGRGKPSAGTRTTYFSRAPAEIRAAHFKPALVSHLQRLCLEAAGDAPAHDRWLMAHSRRARQSTSVGARIIAAKALPHVA